MFEINLSTRVLLMFGLSLACLGCRTQRSESNVPHRHIYIAEKGTWSGPAEILDIYEDDGKVVKALCIATPPGQVKKSDVLSDKPVLIDANLKLLDPSPYLGKIIKVKGRIFCTNPINPVNNQFLWCNCPTNTSPLRNSFFEGVDVIKVKPEDIIDLGAAPDGKTQN